MSWERVCGERPVGMVQTFSVFCGGFVLGLLTMCFESGVRDFWGLGLELSWLDFERMCR